MVTDTNILVTIANAWYIGLALLLIAGALLLNLNQLAKSKVSARTKIEKENL